jgi:hypothetical protein
MAKMHELYALMEGIETNLQCIDEIASESQKRKLVDIVETIAFYGLTPEEARRLWARRYDKAVYNAPYNRSLRQARRKPTPKGDGWDAEHQLGTVSARKSKKGSK